MDFFGSQLQERVQDAIARRPGGHLPVGASLVVRTGHGRIPFLIVVANHARTRGRQRRPQLSSDAGPARSCGWPVIIRRSAEKCTALGSGPASEGLHRARLCGRLRGLMPTGLPATGNELCVRIAS